MDSILSLLDIIVKRAGARKQHLRLMLGCEKVDYDASTIIIVLDVQRRVIGAAMDSASNVIVLITQDIRPMPARLDSAALVPIGAS